VALMSSCGKKAPSSRRVYIPDIRMVAALPHAAFSPLPLGCIRPSGWLKRQLQIQADGLGGHIEDIWPDLSAASAWRGGNGEAWERGPYYLDGLVPLAFELDDAGLLAKMQAWMDWNLDHQRPDGALGPDRPRDWWPDMVFLKALAQYGEASGDPRVLPAMQRYASYLQAQLPQRRLDAWKANRPYDEVARGSEDLVGNSDRWQYYRWTEMVGDLLWLYARTGDKGLWKLALDLKAQGYDWEGHFRNFRFKEKTKYVDRFLASHGVNNAMGIKAGALDLVLEGKAGAMRGLDELNRWHGQANGTFSADEQLAGLSPSQGTELCTVVEEMYSLETLSWATGEPRAAEALERLAYNALPAAFDERMWTHQYDQQANQVLVSIAPRAWSNNQDHANLFGLEPEWGCCTANFHQGWPKFTSHLWMATAEGGLAALSYAPCSINARLPSGVDVGLEVLGEYPFEGDVSIRLHSQAPLELPILLRIPSWAQGAVATVNAVAYPAKPGRFLRIRRSWREGDMIKLSLPMRSHVEAYHGAMVVNRGPLLMALDIAPDIHSLGPDAWSDRELSPQGDWNLAILAKPGELIPETLVQTRPADGNVFDRASVAVELKLRGRLASNWTLQSNSAGDPPRRAVLQGPEVPARLIPYGAAKLRISVFPALP
jgi:hypothetical protein